MESLFYAPLLGSIRLFVSAPTPAFPALAVFFDGRFFHSSYPPFIDTALLSMASLEMLAVIVSLKLWSEELRGQRILVRTDKTLNLPSTPVAHVSLLFNHVYANFGFMLPVLILSLAPLISRVTRTPLLPDSLSRWDNDPQFQHTFYEAAHLHYNALTEYICSFDLFRFDCQW